MTDPPEGASVRADQLEAAARILAAEEEKINEAFVALGRALNRVRDIGTMIDAVDPAGSNVVATTNMVRPDLTAIQADVVGRIRTEAAALNDRATQVQAGHEHAAARDATAADGSST